MRRHSRWGVTLGAAAALLAVAVHCSAWQVPYARDITVSTNRFVTTNMGTTVQQALEYINSNMLTTADGLIDAATLNTRLSSSSTQIFGEVNIVVSPTNALLQLGQLYGFRAALNASTTQHITTNSLAYVQVTTETNLFNPQSWYSGGTTSKFTPLIAGYYWVGAEIRCSTNALFRIVSQYTNEIVTVGGTVSSNTPVAGGGIVYATGTSTNFYWLEGIPVNGATSAPVTRAVFQSYYLGGN